MTLLRGMRLVMALLLAVSSNAWPDSGPRAAVMTGGQFSYRVAAGDILQAIGARLGVSVAALARDNGIPNPDLILPGRMLRVDNRHIIPEAPADGIVINIPQRMLFFFHGGALAASYPVCVGMPTWPTVQGAYHVLVLQKNPVWLVPKSIQEEMAREGQIVTERVSPGEDNPLGKFWIGLDAPGYGIHDTIAPASIYRFQSHGCIRLHRDDIAALFPRVTKGLAVKLIYRPVLLAEEGNHVFAEINPDVYKLAPRALETAHRLAEAGGFAARIDWCRLEQEVLRKEGIARDVTLGGPKENRQ